MMRQRRRQMMAWIFSLQGKFIIVATVCIVFFTFAGGIIFLYREEKLYRQDIVNQGKVIAEISRLMLTNVMIYNELGMMDDHDLRDFLDYFIIDFMKMDARVKFVSVVDTEGKVLACSAISKNNDSCLDVMTIRNLPTQEMGLYFGSFNGESTLNIAVPLNISNKSWGGLRIALSSSNVESAIASLRKEILLIALLFSTLSLLVVRVGAMVLAKPVIRLSGIMDSIKDHIDLEHVETTSELPVFQERRDEIGRLQKSFLWMVQRLRDADRDRKKSMETLIQTEKMVSIGRLASGVAHEINNPLGGIAVCFNNLVKGELDGEAEKEHIEVINESLHKIGKIVGQLLHFSKMTIKEMRPGDINSLITRVLLLLGYHLNDKRINVVSEMDSELSPVLMDENMISQVFMNIIINALQAMDAGGTISIRTGREDDYCVVSIIDSGPGIPADVLPCIFDLFFTTKSEGNGTGLGLSISKSIVEQHGGGIDVESKFGQGVHFKISLPLMQDTVSGCDDLFSAGYSH